MKKFYLTLAALVGVVAMNAQEVEPKEAIEGGASPEISELRLAADLVKYGYAKQNALPLIDALQIIIDTPTQPGATKEQEEAVTVEATEGKQGNVTLDVAEIVASAKQFAEGDPTMLALLAEVEESAQGAHRGAVGGAKYNVDVVRAGATDTYNVSFVKGYLAEVALSGDGDTDLDLYVYDANGNLIASDTDYTDDCYVCWVPAWTGSYKIKVVNRGRLANRYVLVTN